MWTESRSDRLRLQDGVNAHWRLTRIDATAPVGLPVLRDFAAAVRDGGLSIIALIERRAGSTRNLQRGAASTGAFELSADALVDASAAAYSDESGRSLEDLTSLRRALAIPLLRTEPVIGEFQVHESRWAGADAVRLRADLLDPEELRDLIGECHSLGMAAVLSVREEAELARALESNADVVAIDARDPLTGGPSLFRARRMRAAVPAGRLTMAENAVQHRDELDALEKAGFDAVLIGAGRRDTSGDSRAWTALAV